MFPGISTIVGVTVLGLALAAAVRFMRRTEDLRLGLFRPYRRDAWPIGVQEDDDFRFNWRPRPDPGPDVEVVLDTGVAVDAWFGIEECDVDEPEDRVGDPVSLARPAHIEVNASRGRRTPKPALPVVPDPDRRG